MSTLENKGGRDEEISPCINSSLRGAFFPPFFARRNFPHLRCFSFHFLSSIAAGEKRRYDNRRMSSSFVCVHFLRLKIPQSSFPGLNVYILAPSSIAGSRSNVNQRAGLARLTRRIHAVVGRRRPAWHRLTRVGRAGPSFTLVHIQTGKRRHILDLGTG